MRKSGLPPVIDENTKILILGTLPSDMSLAARQYYANPGNCRRVNIAPSSNYL
jgi:hypothetical protein